MSGGPAVARYRGPTAVGRRPAPPREPDLHARRQRLQAALLRVGARLPVDVDAAAPAVRRSLLRVHRSGPLRERRGALPGLPAGGNRPVHVLLRDHEPRRDLAHRARDPAPEDSLPAHGGAAVRGAPRALQSRTQPARRIRLRVRVRHRPTLGVARDGAADPAARDALHRHDDAALRSVRALPRRPADLGGDPPDPVLRVPDHLRDGELPGQHRARGNGQPDHRDPHPNAPRAHRPRSSDRGGGDRRRRCGY